MQVDINKMIEVIGADRAHDILSVLGISNLRDVDSRDCIIVGYKWRCGVERRWWAIEARQMRLSDEYSVRWTSAKEAGIDDVEIVEHYGDEGEDTASLSEWAHNIALNCGSCDGTVM